MLVEKDSKLKNNTATMIAGIIKYIFLFIFKISLCFKKDSNIGIRIKRKKHSYWDDFECFIEVGLVNK